MDLVDREKNMTRQDKWGVAGPCRRICRERIVAGDMSVNDVDVQIANDACECPARKNVDRVAHSNLTDVAPWQRREVRCQRRSRIYRRVNFMSAVSQRI